MESRQYLLSLQLIIRNSSLLRLLPRLLQAGKLPHGRNRMAAGLKLILGVPFTLENGRVNGAKREVIHCARKVKKT